MAWLCGNWLAGIAGSNLAQEHGCLSLVNIVCCAGTGLCDEAIPRAGQPYLVCVCVVSVTG